MIQYINKIFGKSRWWEIALFLVLFVIFTSGFSYVGWPERTKTLPRIISVLFLVYFIINVRLSEQQNFRYYVLALAFIPFVSVFYSFMEYDQPILDGIKGTLPSLLWLFYFVLHRYKVKPGSFFKAVFFVAIFIALVQIIQQFTYPNILFGAHIDEDSLNPNEELVKNRNGLWRFTFSETFAAIILFTLWCKLQKKFTIKLALPILLMLISLYLTLTRQIIISVLLTLFVSYLISKKGLNIWMFALGILAVGFLVFYSDLLFKNFIEQTNTELNTGSYVRIRAAKYFLNETFSSVSAMFMGHGNPVSGEFLRLHQETSQVNRYFVGDVGFIGRMWKYGIIYVIVCYALLINIFWKQRHSIPLSIRLFTLFSIIPSIMIFPFTTFLKQIIWCSLLYYCDRTINIMKLVKMRDERQ